VVYAQSYTSEISGGVADFALIILVVDLDFLYQEGLLQLS
jgi:hypothetical protein